MNNKRNQGLLLALLRAPAPPLPGALAGLGGIVGGVLGGLQSRGQNFDPAMLRSARPVYDDPLDVLCPVLREPDPVIRPDPWWLRWYLATLKWLVRHL